MAPKKDKAKGKKEEDAGRSGFSETEKTFLELQIAEANRKIARLRSAVEEYEIRNEELQKAYDELDEDRADIIAYLKKTLTSKHEENTELRDKVKGLEETRELETAQFNETVSELERNFTIMKDQLTSENKLLAGKLNTLEEFRAIRDDLMKKFEKQEQDIKDQEIRHKRLLYDTEKKFVIGKDKLKHEMESRLLQLAQDFQDATELRVAASTQRVIRENIAINNELETILADQSKLVEKNERYRESKENARLALELAQEERDEAINKNVVQLKVIDHLTNAYKEVMKEKASYDKNFSDYNLLQEKLLKLTQKNDKLTTQMRILEQNLHAQLSDQNKKNVETVTMINDFATLKQCLKEAAMSVQASLKLNDWAFKDPSREIMDRQVLLSQLLNILKQYHELEPSRSVDTLASLGKVYKEGDLGFVPKTVTKESGRYSRVSNREELAEKEPSISRSSSSIVSLRTIPSKIILSKTSQTKTESKVSLPSLFTTLQLSETESQKEVESDVDDVENKLALSKLAIQKSIIKDLAYSNYGIQSLSKISAHVKSDSKVSKYDPEDSLNDESVHDKEKADISEEHHVEELGTTEELSDKEEKSPSSEV